MVHSISDERRLENCIWKAMQVSIAANSRTSAADFRKAVFTGLDYQSAPHTPQSILSSLSDPATRSRVQALHVRYIVVARSTTSNGTKKWTSGGWKDLPAERFAADWLRVGTVEARVIDVSAATEVGAVVGMASEMASFRAAVVVIIPLVKPDMHHTYATACKAAGLKLGKFITSGKPPRMQ